MKPEPLPDKPPYPLEVLQTPFCGDLRSKKFYMRDEILTKEEDYRDASGHIFCYHTQMPIGPDGMRAAPEHCGPDRACYRSAMEKPVEYWAVNQRMQQRLAQGIGLPKPDQSTEV